MSILPFFFLFLHPNQSVFYIFFIYMHSYFTINYNYQSWSLEVGMLNINSLKTTIFITYWLFYHSFCPVKGILKNKQVFFVTEVKQHGLDLFEKMCLFFYCNEHCLVFCTMLRVLGYSLCWSLEHKRKSKLLKNFRMKADKKATRKNKFGLVVK